MYKNNTKMKGSMTNNLRNNRGECDEMNLFMRRDAFNMLKRLTIKNKGATIRP